MKERYADQTKKHEVTVACGTHGKEMRTRVFIAKPEG
jgi:hypothetical protein